ncbi:MAG: M23 family metallopeptidase [Candidatus Obscuribacterales bacterium]|nr:M23 family metallopeptidase [Candidatus Obscuribacterales bacterium]
MMSLARLFALLAMFWVFPVVLSVTPADARAQAADITKSTAVDSIKISNLSPRQGETVSVVLPRTYVDSLGLGDSRLIVEFAGETIPLYPQEKDSQALLSTLIAVPANMKPGGHTFTVCGVEQKLEVKDARFPTQKLRLPPKKNNFTASPGEKEAVQKAKEEASSERHWQGKFQHPVKNARISSRFGLGRIVNGKRLDDYFHAGMDFAAGRGTPVLACAKGKVILAASGWKLHGNTVCIDHGQGVITIYIHMNSLKVKTGDLVEMAEQIGTVGSTGRASGPHLHLGLYVNKVAANPEPWFARTF